MIHNGEEETEACTRYAYILLLTIPIINSIPSMKWSTRSSQIKRKKESQKPEEKIKGQEPIKENEEKNQTLQWHSSKSLR